MNTSHHPERLPDEAHGQQLPEAQQPFGFRSVPFPISNHWDPVVSTECVEGFKGSPIATKETQWQWSNVRNKNVYHLVSNVHTYIDPTELPAAGARLEAAFQAASVHCNFQSSKVYCRTLDPIEFVVALWKDNGALLVELDQTSGDSMPFWSTYTPLVLNAIRGTTVDATPPLPPSVLTWCGPTTTTPESTHNTVESLLESFPTDTLLSGYDEMSLLECELQAMDEQLSSPRYDWHHQALDTLSRWMDPTVTMPNIVTAVCRMVAAGAASTVTDDASRRRHDAIHTHVLKLALGGIVNASHGSAHGYTALTLVAQAVSNVDTEDMIRFVHAVDQQWEGGLEAVVPLLMHHVQAASERPHVAYWSTRILTALVRVGGRSLGNAVCVPTIQHANVVGTCRHAALAQASHQLLLQLSMAN